MNEKTKDQPDSDPNSLGMEALRQRIKALEAAQDLAEDGLIILNAEGAVVSMNAAADVLLFGPNADNPHAAASPLFLDWQTPRGEALDPLALLKEGGAIEDLALKPAAGQASVMLSGKHIVSDEGETLYLLKIREASAKTEENPYMKAYRALGRVCPFPLVLTDMQGGIRYINPAGAKLMGYDPETLAEHPKQVARGTVEEEKELDVIAFRQLHEQGWCEPYERSFYTSDGAKHRALIAGMRIEEPTAEDPTLVLIGMDTTTWREAEAEKTRQAQLFEQVFQNAREGMTLLSPDGQSLKINREGLRIFDLLDASDVQLPLVNQYAFKILDEEGRSVEPEQYPLARALQGIEVDNERCVLQYSDSREEKHLDCSTVIMRDRSGTPSQILMSVRDITEQENSRRALKQSEERFRRIVEAGPFGFALVNPGGKIYYCNAPFEHMTGRTLKEMREEDFSWRMMVPPEEEDLVNAAQAELLSCQQCKPYESTVLQPDGTRFPILVSIVMLEEPQGMERVMGVSLVDMSQIVATQVALKSRESEIQSIFDQATAGIGLVEKGKVRFANMKFYEILGCTVDSQVELDLAALLDSERGASMEALRCEARESGRPTLYEGPVQRVDQSEIWVQLSLSPEDATSNHSVVVVVDITDRHKAEEQLLRQHSKTDLQRQRLEAILNFMPVGVVILNTDRVILQGNRAQAKIWEYDPQQSFPFQATDVAVKSVRLIGTGEPFDTEKHGVGYVKRTSEVVSELGLEVEFPNGKQKSLLVWFVPVITHENKLRNIIQISLDVTQQHQSVQEVQRLNQTLEDRIAERTASLLEQQALLRNLASELTLAEQRERLRFATDLHDYLPQILVACKMKTIRINDLIRSKRARSILKEVDSALDQALDYSRTLVAELSPTVLYEFGLEAALPYLGEEMKRRGLQVQFEETGEEAAIPNDLAILIYQTIREFLVNVIKHARTSHADVSLNWMGKRLLVEITDEGKGFDHIQHGVLSVPRAGFGLFSIRERLEALGGKMRIDSQPGEGTRIALDIPLVNDIPQSFQSAPQTQIYPDDEDAGDALKIREPFETEGYGRPVRLLMLAESEQLHELLSRLREHHRNIHVMKSDEPEYENNVSGHILLPDVLVVEDCRECLEKMEMLQENSHRRIASIGIPLSGDTESREWLEEAGVHMIAGPDLSESVLWKAILACLDKATEKP